MDKRNLHIVKNVTSVTLLVLLVASGSVLVYKLVDQFGPGNLLPKFPENPNIWVSLFLLTELATVVIPLIRDTTGLVSQEDDGIDPTKMHMGGGGLAALFGGGSGIYTYTFYTQTSSFIDGVLQLYPERGPYTGIWVSLALATLAVIQAWVPAVRRSPQLSQHRHNSHRT